MLDFMSLLIVYLMAITCPDLSGYLLVGRQARPDDASRTGNLAELMPIPTISVIFMHACFKQAQFQHNFTCNNIASIKSY
jgi:hypothetical protein